MKHQKPRPVEELGELATFITTFDDDTATRVWSAVRKVVKNANYEVTTHEPADDGVVYLAIAGRHEPVEMSMLTDACDDIDRALRQDADNGMTYCYYK